MVMSRREMGDALRRHDEPSCGVEEEEMMLPPPPPPPHIKLLDRRCMYAVINNLDAKSVESMARSCRFFRNACAAAADLVILPRTAHHLSDAASAHPSQANDSDTQDLVRDNDNLNSLSSCSSFDAPIDEMSLATLEELLLRRVVSPHTDPPQEDVVVRARINDNNLAPSISAPSFDECDDKEESTVLLSFGVKVLLHDRDFNRSFDDSLKNEPVSFDKISSCITRSTASSSVSIGTPVSFSSTFGSDHQCERHDEMTSMNSGVKTVEDEDGDNEMSTAVAPLSAENAMPFSTIHSAVTQGEGKNLEGLHAFNPLLSSSLKTMHTKKERTCTSSIASMQRSSTYDGDCDTANDVGNHSVHAEVAQSANHDGDSDDDVDYTSCNPVGFDSDEAVGFGTSFVSDYLMPIFGSAKDVANVLMFSNRKNDIDDQGLIQIGDKFYSQNEALKMWRKAKANLEDTYAMVDKSGNEKFESTTFFEKSIMFKEKTTKMEAKKLGHLAQKSRNEVSAKPPSTKKRLPKMDDWAITDSGNFETTTFFEKSSMFREKTAKMEAKLAYLDQKNRIQAPTERTSTGKQEGDDDAVTDSLEQHNMGNQPTPVEQKMVNEEFDNGTDCSLNSSSSNDQSSNSSCSNDESDSDTSSFGISDFDPSSSGRLPRLRPRTPMRSVTPINEDGSSVATPLSTTVDSVLGSNYGVEVSSTCCKFVSGKSPSLIIKDARGYKETEIVPKPERVLSTPTRKPRLLSNAGMGISSSKRRNSKPVNEGKKKSTRSFTMKLIKKSTK